MADTELAAVRRELSAMKARIERLEQRTPAAEPDWPPRLGAAFTQRQGEARQALHLHPPPATPAQIRAMLVEAGVRPEDRVASSLLAQMRGSEA
jgi:hypothetical protein